MHDLRYLHELDRSIVSVIKDYAHQNNFPEFNELLIDLKSIEKNTEKGYSDNKIKNSELSTMIDNQNKLRINLNEKLEYYNQNNDKKTTYNDIKNLINNYIVNFNNIQEFINNGGKSGSKEDTI
jgi:hypothetical protein|tara:strand:+ start:2311 stop:2682 length:372 start_codon:yes stop_codon:yes gene_type:complete